MTAVTSFPRLNTEKEEAARLNLSDRTLQAWRTRGDGPPFVKLGRAVRYDPRATDEWLATRARRNTADPGP
ncbi:MAG: DNA-binding protein, partial [Gammaproteobacteria bacterium]|nr:DNA-binding protein [Gammaproteobacteria bacterium]